MQNKDKGGTVPKLVYRKTSAEIVSEAKNLLASGSVKLVSTRRPITPHVNKRQLYGKDGPANRPPSAFNLKYLQYETRALPCLEPISSDEKDVHKRVERSGSLGTIHESTVQTRLPALLEPPRIRTAGSVEDCKYSLTSIMRSLSRDITIHLQNLNLHYGPFYSGAQSQKSINEMNFCPFSIPCSLTVKDSMPLRKGSSISLPCDGEAKDHPLKRKQPLSFDADRSVSVVEASEIKLSVDLTKNRLIRSNDLLTQTPTEVLLELLKAYAGVKECAEETQIHLYMVTKARDDVTNIIVNLLFRSCSSCTRVSRE